MTSEQHNPEEIFNAARAIADQKERDSYLQGACDSDLAMRGRIDALLKADAEAGSFLADGKGEQIAESGDVGAEGDPDATVARRADRSQKRFTETPGTQIGPYRLLERIGEGGFGEVWVAEQRQPVRRKVALKIVKAGMDSREVLARFAAERQALALMDHPGVAKVFDAGATDSGRPYFVMEYVAGLPINEYCDTTRLKISDRLALFIQVCQVVQHAHQKGIIHRDLKPSNILVTPPLSPPLAKGGSGGVGEVKVIDFGIAKATIGRLTDRTLYTEMGKLIGTPEYMSPEQTGTSGLDVDTRADIYSLGVILYELLTGTLPFDAKTLRNAGFDAMAKIIRELEPPKPSTRLTTLAEEAVNRRDGKTPQDIARAHDTDFRTLRREVRGDLDWITLKALEKDRTRRYATASALAEDLARHLNHEPVLAGPASAAYHVRKLVYKHRRLVAAVCAVVFALSVGLAASMVLFFQAREASRKAIRTQRFLQDMLSVADPYNREPKPTGYSVRELMSEAGKRATTELVNEPEVRSAIQHTIGSTYLGLGLYHEAEGYLEDAVATRRRILGEDHPDTLDSLKGLASLRTQQGRYAEAEAVYKNLAPLLERVRGVEHQDTLWGRMGLAWVVGRLGRIRESAILHEKAIEECRRVLGRDHEITFYALSNYAWVLIDLGRAAQAETYLQESLEGTRRVFGDEDIRTLRARNNYARVLGIQGKFDEATPLFEANFETSAKLLDERHPLALIALGNLGWTYTNSGRVQEGESLQRKAFAAVQSVSGPEHPETLIAAHLLAENLIAQSRDAEAEDLLQSTLEIRRRVTGDQHVDTLWTVNVLGRLLIRQNRQDEAEELLVGSYDRAATGADSNRQFQCLIASIVNLYEQRDAAEPGKGHAAKAEEYRALLEAKHEDSAGK